MKRERTDGDTTRYDAARTMAHETNEKLSLQFLCLQVNVTCNSSNYTTLVLLINNKPVICFVRA